MGWKQLAEASFALARDADGNGIPWVATNTDWTIPQERGIAPGNGTLVSAVHTAVGILPVVAGKPEVAIFDEAVARSRRVLAFSSATGSTPTSLGANRAGIPSVMVLTGWIGPSRCSLLRRTRVRLSFEDLRGLAEPYPQPKMSETGPRRRFGKPRARDGRTM